MLREVWGDGEGIGREGHRYLGRITTVDAKAVRVEVDSFEKAQAPRLRMTLLQSIPKGKAMDLILRIATEIGATCVQPVFTDQGEVQMKGERLISKIEKWRLTMIESCVMWLGHLPNWRAVFFGRVGQFGETSILGHQSRSG